MCDIPSCFQEITRKARKVHRCCECRGDILPGETYQYVSGIWDGEPYDFKTCSDCASLRSEAESRNRTSSIDCGPTFGNLWEFISDYEDEVSEKEFHAIINKRGSKMLKVTAQEGGSTHA